MQNAKCKNQTGLISESYHVPSTDSGIHIYVRNTRPEELSTFRPDRTLLFVHGDIPIGHDVRFEDRRRILDGLHRQPRLRRVLDGRPRLRAVVASTRDGTAGHGEPASRDDGRWRRGFRSRGRSHPPAPWRAAAEPDGSWGTVIAGAYAAADPDKVERLVMCAPLWLRRIPGGLRVNGQMGAYRTVTLEAAKQRWLTGVARDRQNDLIPPGVFESWWAANMAADPVGARMTPPAVRAPNGLLVDAFRYWEADTRYYDPSAIRAPVLLVVGDWDVDTPAYMAQALLARLTGSARKRLVIVGEATHHLMLERNRLQMFREVQSFLDERWM